MTFDFSRLLPPEVAARLERSKVRVDRLYGLPDRWLGREIAGLVRRIRASVPEFASPASEGDGYSKHMLWDVVPELARRLGEPLLPNESSDADLRRAGEADLRRDVSTCLFNLSSVRLMRIVPEDLQDDLHMLLLDAANGNPVAVALDRIAPPGPDADDRIARHLREISACRRHVPTSSWHPGLQHPPGPEISTGPSPRF